MTTGGRLGVGNDPRYNKSRCFETVPFPAEDTGLTPELAERIRQLAEQLDAHRKARQAAHEPVTLTGLYNVLDKLRSGEPLNAKDKLLHEQGLVSVLRSLHDNLDAAVLQAYGWADLGLVPWAGHGGDEAGRAARAAWTDALLERLVALNARRAAEEATGLVRWLRPEFQDPARRSAAASDAATAGASDVAEAVAGSTATGPQTELDIPADDPAEADDDPTRVGHGGGSALTAPAGPARRPWPASLPEQMRAVADALAASPNALGEAALAERFSGRGPWKKRLPQILQTLEALGRARTEATAAGTVWRA